MAPLEGHYDVVVAGGGLIGASAALGVASQGRRVLLVEPNEPGVQRGRLGVDVRNVAVSPASRALLDSLGTWDGLPAAPYRRMEVWEERGTRAMVFDATDVGREELGWMVENSPAVAALWQALTACGEATLCAARVQGVEPTPRGVEVVLDLGTVSTNLVIAADGAGSVVRQCLGVAVRGVEVGQVALATVIRTARPHESSAYQRFLLDGPLALLPSTDPRQCSIVWSQSPAQAERRLAMDDRSFRRELERAVRLRLGPVEAVDRRVAFPLTQQWATSFAPHPRVLLIGDAARVLHPMAGLGGNLGFEDVRELLQVLGGIGAGGDPGSEGLWRSFDRQRRARARLMLAVMDALRQVYARGDPLSQWLRNVGVGWLNGAVGIKRQIIMEAMGLGPVSGGSADLAPSAAESGHR